MSGDGSVASMSSADRWARTPAVPQQREDTLPEEAAVAKWQQIYNLFGATGESARDEVFVAVNGYMAINGASPDGRYSREIKTAGGVSVSASEVIKITGRLKGDVRQFLRGMSKKSYECLKHSAVLREDTHALARAESAGIPRHMVHLLADWLRGCEWLTAEEEDIYKVVSSRNIASAQTRGSEKEVRGDMGNSVVEVVPEVTSRSNVVTSAY